MELLLLVSRQAQADRTETEMPSRGSVVRRVVPHLGVAETIGERTRAAAAAEAPEGLLLGPVIGTTGLTKSKLGATTTMDRAVTELLPPREQHRGIKPLARSRLPCPASPVTLATALLRAWVLLLGLPGRLAQLASEPLLELPAG